MRRILITLLCALAIMGAGAQTANTSKQKSQAGTTIQVQDKTTSKSKGKPTEWLYPTKDGQLLPVLQGSKGGLYVERVSKKTGKPYRQYINEKNKSKLIHK